MFGKTQKPQEKTLLTTLTGEPYQPARIYYEVFNQKTVIGAFKKLRCMQWEPRMNAWRWLYDGEAKKLRFDRSWNKIPKEHRPIVIGDFFFRSNTEMLLDVRSFKRVTRAITFFDKHINRRAARVSKLRVVNRFFDGKKDPDLEHIHPPFDYFFDRPDIKKPDPAALLRNAERAVADIEDSEAQLKTLGKFLEQQEVQSQSEVEELPEVFYEDGIEHLEFMLLVRSAQALEHWRGNTSFTQYDFIEQLMQRIGSEAFTDLDDEFLEEGEDQVPADAAPEPEAEG
jgi:hypothetical protein